MIISWIVFWKEAGDLRFNNVVAALRAWCADASERYRAEASAELEAQGGTKRYPMFWFADSMGYQLASLIDREFRSFEEFREAARSLVGEKIHSGLIQEKDPAALMLADQAEGAFLAYLDSVPEDVSAEHGPYYRVVVGAERDELAYAILEKWDYAADCWYPLAGGFDESKLYLDAELLEPYMDRLLDLLGLPEERVYEYGESWYIDEHCAEVDDLYGYGGNEVVYVPKDLSWIIYFSHEGTVTFGGDIVPAVKKLLRDEMEHWNKY